ncbi:MAG: RNA polymerase factor sigma-54 [Bacillota bacterium]|nr:RNA polymerase factor sigma-54 [Bacillota bacterium]
MNLKAGLWQQQTLKLAMTQELTQAIALLQYSAQELTEFLENKALENPLFTVENKAIRVPKKPDKDKTYWIEQIADKTFSLEDYLLAQLNLKKYTKQQLKIIRHLIQCLDENGYFRGNTQEMADNHRVSVDLIEEGLQIIQKMEPVGIGARGLQECLLLQLQRMEPENKLAQTILAEYFLPFAEKKWKMISNELQVTMKEIQDVFDQLQHLNPKPCANFSDGPTSYVAPDAVIEWGSEGFIVRLNDYLLPKIGLNEHYYHQFSNNDDAQVSRFLHEKYQDFQFVLKSIEQRKETLMKVIYKIVEKQTDFFRKGPEYLKPMTMKEISSELSVHESTISRAVREKFVQTPLGTFPLKFFFTSNIQTVSEESTSSSQVKSVLSLLIEKENKIKPYSDQEIVDYLKNNEGILVSRRTIAKYRDQLGLPSSSKRKRFD